MQAAHNGVLALALRMQWHWHEFLLLLLELFIGGSQQRTEVQEHSRCVTDSPHPFFFTVQKSCAVAAVYAVLNDGHRSISRLSALSTATHADRCLSARPRNGPRRGGTTGGGVGSLAGYTTRVTPPHVGVNVVTQDSEFLTMNATKDCKYELCQQLQP